MFFQIVSIWIVDKQVGAANYGLSYCSLKPATQGLNFPTLLAAVSATNKTVFSLQGSGGAPHLSKLAR